MSDIVIAPFSNSAIRDWPISHFADLIALLRNHADDGTLIRVVGTANQRLSACEIVRHHPPATVINDCGRLSWTALLSRLQQARCVIGNNSGIAHVAGYLGAPTICLFGGSHQRLEWRPRGPNVTVLSRAIACSPCQLDHGHKSRYAKACLKEITPEAACEAVLRAVNLQATGKCAQRTH